MSRLIDKIPSFLESDLADEILVDLLKRRYIQLHETGDEDGDSEIWEVMRGFETVLEYYLDPTEQHYFFEGLKDE